MATHTYKNLEVWQRSIKLAGDVYQVCGQLPPEEMYALSSQLRRAAASVPSNIAEGQKRLNEKEFVQFLGIGLGSLAELETQLILVKNLYTI